MVRERSAETRGKHSRPGGLGPIKLVARKKIDRTSPFRDRKIDGTRLFTIIAGFNLNFKFSAKKGELIGEVPCRGATFRPGTVQLRCEPFEKIQIDPAISMIKSGTCRVAPNKTNRWAPRRDPCSIPTRTRKGLRAIRSAGVSREFFAS